MRLEMLTTFSEALRELRQIRDLVLYLLFFFALHIAQHRWMISLLVNQ